MKKTTNTRSNSDAMLAVGIDYQKRYSVVHVLDAEGETIKKGRVEPNTPAAFEVFFAEFRADQLRCVFEASMNWGYLYDLLTEFKQVTDVTLAHPFKTRIIAEAQIKTDKLDAKWLAHLHRAGLIATAHACSRQTSRRKELLRQRSYFVKQHTALRNRLHLLLGGQQQLEMPQVSDLFGRKGLEALGKLRLERFSEVFRH